MEPERRLMTVTENKRERGKATIKRLYLPQSWYDDMELSETNTVIAEYNPYKHSITITKSQFRKTPLSMGELKKEEKKY